MESRASSLVGDGERHRDGRTNAPGEQMGFLSQGIHWLYRNESGLSVTLQKQVHTLRLIERSLWLGLVLLFVIYGAAVRLKPG